MNNKTTRLPGRPQEHTISEFRLRLMAYDYDVPESAIYWWKRSNPTSNGRPLFVRGRKGRSGFYKIRLNLPQDLCLIPSSWKKYRLGVRLELLSKPTRRARWSEVQSLIFLLTTYAVPLNKPGKDDHGVLLSTEGRVSNQYDREVILADSHRRTLHFLLDFDMIEDSSAEYAGTNGDHRILVKVFTEAKYECVIETLYEITDMVPALKDLIRLIDRFAAEPPHVRIYIMKCLGLIQSSGVPAEDVSEWTHKNRREKISVSRSTDYRMRQNATVKKFIAIVSSTRSENDHHSWKIKEELQREGRKAYLSTDE